MDVIMVRVWMLWYLRSFAYERYHDLTMDVLVMARTRKLTLS